MTALSVDDRRRLIKVLAMLGSIHEGERAAAGLLATRIIQSAGTDWGHLLQLQGCGSSRAPSDYSPPPVSDIGLCVRNLRRLTQWEQDFVLNLRSSSFLTVAQRQKLTQIAADLRKAGAA